MSIDVLTVADPRWNETISELTGDFYHTSNYHKLHETPDGDEGLLLVYREGTQAVALPIIRRSLKTIDALAPDFSEQYDATSVYGYGGPISNHSLEDQAFYQRFGDALNDTLHDLNIICIFSRLHPILENDAMVTIGDVIDVGQTVSIDLTQPETLQFKEYRSNHKRNIKKALKHDIVVYPDKTWEHYDDFRRIYSVTMDRVEATDYYYFSDDYFDDLRAELGDILQLFVVKLDDTVLSAGLFTLYNGIIQYHLGASDPIGMEYASSKLMMDGVRRWGNTVDAHVMHLGGGLGGSIDDSLFRFKAGFSNRRHTFKLWKHIVNHEQYNAAVSGLENWLIQQGATMPQTSFFPLYRAPVKVGQSE